MNTESMGDAECTLVCGIGVKLECTLANMPYLDFLPVAALPSRL